jgi:hypothetical protein
MAKSFSVGGVVEAAGKVTEKGFLGKRVWVHAEPGDLGSIESVDGEWFTVTWHRKGTTTDCHLDELRRPVSDGHAHGGVPRTTT